MALNPVAARRAIPAPAPRPPAAARGPAFPGEGTAYGLAGLEAECRSVATAGPGERHPALNRAAFAAGQLVAGGELGEAHAATSLRAAASELVAEGREREVERTIADGLEAGAREPRSAPDRPAGSNGTPPGHAVEPVPLEALHDEEHATDGHSPPPWTIEPAQADPGPRVRDGVGGDDAWRAGFVEQGSPIPAPCDLYADEVRPERPEFMVSSLFRRYGVALEWAQPGGFKTSLTLRMIHEAHGAAATDRLLDNPGLRIEHPPSRVLMLTTEETIGELRFVADAVRRGMDRPEPLPPGTLVHLYAHQPGRRITLRDLPAIYGDHGPFSWCVLDSLTGLRPKQIGGRRIEWDKDNDSANDIMLDLRGWASEWRTLIHVLHHSDKLVQHYRGPVDWWASTDTMFGLLAVDGRVRVKPEKTRGGPRLDPFLIEPTWDADTLRFAYRGADTTTDGAPLSPTAAKVLAFLKGRGPTMQSIIPDQIDASRNAVADAFKVLETRGEAERTGNVHRGSPEWVAVAHVVGQVEE